MKSLRISLFLCTALMAAVTAKAQSLPAVVKAAANAAPAAPRAKRVITNDDIPSVVESESAPKSAPAAFSKDGDADDEVCQYVGDLRSEEQQLESRVKKLQASLEKADSDLLRSVYGNALLRLTDSLNSKQAAREEAESALPAGGCAARPPKQKAGEKR